nr:methylated-DNA--[protein]-cysteine S-methyltransferase [Burkholderia sp. BCC1644]
MWHALRSVPPGTTTTYGKLAKDLGFDDPRAAIDIGAANAANPIAIVVPCHRVIASNGDLRGYAWGVHRKRWLLGHEKVPAFANRVRYAMSLPGFQGRPDGEVSRTHASRKGAHVNNGQFRSRRIVVRALSGDNRSARPGERACEAALAFRALENSNDVHPAAQSPPRPASTRRRAASRSDGG